MTGISDTEHLWLQAQSVRIFDETEEDAYAELDLQRGSRTGLMEAIYSPGKSEEQVAAITEKMLQSGQSPVIVTRATLELAQSLEHRYLGASVFPKSPNTPGVRTIVWNRREAIDLRVGIVTAGTADLEVAKEVEATLYALGASPHLYVDIGVAGLDRLMGRLEELREEDVLVVCAGMEGALVSVLGGLVQAPIIAVPTSKGYGSSLEGVTAALGMLSSCSAGITVVGIDNGFGAGCAAARIWKNFHPRRDEK